MERLGAVAVLGIRLIIMGFNASERSELVGRSNTGHRSELVGRSANAGERSELVIRFTIVGERSELVDNHCC